MRGDYTITVVAQDDGDGNINQTLVQAKSFVLSVRSDSEAPIISAPTNMVALVGQAMVIPVSVRDLDQDALTYTILSGPPGATLLKVIESMSLSAQAKVLPSAQ